MAGPRGSKYYNIYLQYEVWLKSREGEGWIGDKFIQLLKSIDRENSLSAAARASNVSYRKAWGDLKAAEMFLGFNLVEKQRGGRSGGLTKLTPDGQELVQAFDELHEEFDLAIHKITRRFFHQLNKMKNSE